MYDKAWVQNAEFKVSGSRFEVRGSRFKVEPRTLNIELLTPAITITADVDLGFDADSIKIGISPSDKDNSLPETIKNAGMNFLDVPALDLFLAPELSLIEKQRHYPTGGH